MKLCCIGIDQSITGCGIAVVVDGKVKWVHGWTQVKKQQKLDPELLSWFKPKSTSDDTCKVNRLVQVSGWVLGVVEEWMGKGYAVTVAMEGYALGQKSNRQSDLYELGGMIKGGLWLSGVPFRVYPIQDVKQAWTGTGAADKAQMKQACVDHFNLNFFDQGAAGENLADAVCIAQLLDREMQVRQGHQVEAQVFRTLTKLTSKNPTPLAKRDLIFYTEGVHNKPISKVIEDE